MALTKKQKEILDEFIEALESEDKDYDLPDELANNKEFMLAAVEQLPLTLQFATDELRANREVVLEAVKQDGSSLEYASDELRADREVVLKPHLSRVKCVCLQISNKKVFRPVYP